MSLKTLWSQHFPGVPLPHLEELTPDQLSNLSIFFIELEAQQRCVYQTPLDSGYYGFFFAKPQWDQESPNIFLLGTAFENPERTPDEYKEHPKLLALLDQVPRCSHCDKWIGEKGCPKLPDGEFSHVLCLPGFEAFGQHLDTSQSCPASI